MILTLANLIFPLVLLHVPAMVVGFLPIVLIESLVIWRFRPDLPLGTHFAFTAWGNLVSTLAGLPLMVIVLLIPETMARAAIGVRGEQWPWLAPLFMIVELPLFCLASWVIERWTIKRAAGPEWDARFGRAVLWANVASYSGLAVFWFVTMGSGK